MLKKYGQNLILKHRLCMHDDVLCIRLLQERAPELIPTFRFNVDQRSIVFPDWQAVVDQHFHPAAILPELETKNSCNIPWFIRDCFLGVCVSNDSDRRCWR